MKRYLAIPLLALVLGLGAAVAACKQGEGDRCQIDEDCASGLICNQAIGRCAKAGQNNNAIDALPPIDAPDAPADERLPDAEPPADDAN